MLLNFYLLLLCDCSWNSSTHTNVCTCSCSLWISNSNLRSSSYAGNSDVFLWTCSNWRRSYLYPSPRVSNDNYLHNISCRILPSPCLDGPDSLRACRIQTSRHSFFSRCRSSRICLRRNLWESSSWAPWTPSWTSRSSSWAS